MGSVWLTNRRTMWIVAGLILLLIFVAAIVGAMLLRRGTEIDVNVSAAATATASAAKPVAASPPPTTAPTPTVVAAAPTALPTPTAPPSPPPAAPPAGLPPPGATADPGAPTPAVGVIATAVVISTLPAAPTPEAKPQVPEAKPQAPPPLPTPPPAPKPAAPPAAPSPAAAAKPAPAAGAASGTVAANQETTLRCVDNRVTVTVRPNTLPAGFSLACRLVAAGSVPAPPGPVVGSLVFQLESDGRPELPAEVNLGVGYAGLNVEEAAEPWLVIASLEDGQWRTAPKLATDPPNDFVSATITRLGVYAVYRQG